MKIAFIDDGICEETFCLSQQVEHYRIMSDLRIRRLQEASVPGISHGTLCTAIFSDIYPDNPNPVLDIAVLESGKASIQRLIAALVWCLHHSVKLIHMSLGTVDFNDIAVLNDIIDPLIKRGTIIVSAFHNKHIKSYPAAFPGVFGVRRSMKENSLKNGDFALDPCEGLSDENCFVVRYDKPLYTRQGLKFETNHSNSLAAPVLTGHIAQYLNGHLNAGFTEVFEYLSKSCSTIQGHAPKVRPYLISGGHSTHKPVVAFPWEDENLFDAFLESLTKSGYLVTALSEKAKANAIPISYYLGQNEKINGNLLFTIEFIYDPDIILLCINENRIDMPTDWERVDILVKTDHSHYCMVTEDKTFRFKAVQELVQSLTSYFQPSKDEAK